MSDLKKRKGIVEISRQLLETINQEELALIFSNFFPIGIEQDINGFTPLRYYGFSPLFDIQEEKCALNQYVLIVDKEKMTIKAEKQ